MKNYANELLEKLIDSGLATPDSTQACTDEEISKLEKHFSISLPNSYKEFLSVMGAGAGNFMDGSDFFYPLQLGFKSYAESVLDRWDNPYILTKTDFVFITHGPQFMFFDTTSGEDPPIFYYKEAEYKTEKVNKRFSNWLECRVNDEIESFEETREIREQLGL